MSSACPRSRWGHVAAVINDQLLLWGGVGAREDTGELCLCYSDLIESFNLLTNQWNQLKATSESPFDIPHPCSAARIGVIGKRDIYQFGGRHSSPYLPRIYSSGVYKLDGSTLNWQKILPKGKTTPIGRSQHGLCVLGEKGDEHLVIHGGFGMRKASPVPSGHQFIPTKAKPDLGSYNDVWFFSLQKKIWIPVQCAGKQPRPRQAHSFTTVDPNRAILIGGFNSQEVFNDAFLFKFSTLEWIEMNLDESLIPRGHHSTVVADVPELGPVAFLLWGHGNDFLPLSMTQLIFIDFQTCKNVSISDEPMPTAHQSVGFTVRGDLLFLLRYGGSPYKLGVDIPEALLDIFKYDLKSASDKLICHDLSKPVKEETSSSIENAPFCSNPATSCEGISTKEQKMLPSTPQHVEDVITVVTVQSILAFTRWKKFSAPLSCEKGAEISIPNTRSTLRIHPRGVGETALSTQTTTIGFTVFTFDAKQSQGVHDDEFVSDLIRMSLPPDGDSFQIEMDHEHGLNLDPMASTTSASKVVFFYQPQDPSVKKEHEMKFDERIVVSDKIAACLHPSLVEVIVSPSAAATTAVAPTDSDANFSFFTHFYGLGSYASSFRALSFKKRTISDVLQFDLCIISTRPEHRDRYLAWHNDRCVQPLLLDQSINHLLLSPAESNVVEAGEIEGWDNKSRLKKFLITMQQLLAARDSPIDAWVGTFYFVYRRQELLQRLPTMTASLTILSGVRRQCLRIQWTETSNSCDRVEESAMLSELNLATGDKCGLMRLEPSRLKVLQHYPSHLEMDKLAFLIGSQWKVVAQFIVPVLTNVEIKAIELEETEDQPCRFLNAWIKKHGLKATPEALCSALLSADLGSGAKEIFPEVYKNMNKEALLEPHLQIQRKDLVYDEETDFLGGGGYGEVYKGILRRRGSEQPVAIKVFRDFRRRKTDNEYEMFKKEASVLLQIKPHDNVLCFIGLCAVPRHYALVTEFVNGGSLSSVLQSPDHEEAVNKWQTRIAFAKQIAQGMLHLHYNHPSVIHQDLKSQNVLVNIVPKPIFPFICKIADFGLSKISGISSVTTVQLLSSSLPGGTVTHIAPERYSYRPYGAGDERSKRQLARKADVYSYGVVLWEISERQSPYKDMLADAIRLHVKDGGSLPRCLAIDVPPFFNNMLERCVTFMPKKRPSFRDILLMIMEGERSLSH